MKPLGVAVMSFDETLNLKGRSPAAGCRLHQPASGETHQETTAAAQQEYLPERLNDE